MKKITVEMPTIENLTIRNIAARKKAIAAILQFTADEMIASAERNATKCEIYVEEVTEFAVDGLDMAEIQNELREMGYMTEYYPRRKVFVVEWDEVSCQRLQRMKDEGIKWKVTTREDLKKILEKA